MFGVHLSLLELLISETFCGRRTNLSKQHECHLLARQMSLDAPYLLIPGVPEGSLPHQSGKLREILHITRVNIRKPLLARMRSCCLCGTACSLQSPRRRTRARYYGTSRN